MNMNAAMRFTVIALALISAGCVDRAKNDQVLESLEKMKLVDSPGLTLHKMGGGSSGGSGQLLGTVEIIGEIVSANNSPLPLNLADDIAGAVRNELMKQGCVIKGGGQGGGIHYTAASGVSNANVEKASVYYSFNGSEGRVEVLVIERDYAPEPKTKVVGQLILTANESR